MPVQQTVHQETFTGGEISPLLHSRNQLDTYNRSLGICQNAIVTRHGPVIKRSGTRHIDILLDQTKKSILVPFIFSTGDAYILEFSEFEIRVYKNESRVGGVLITTTYTEAQLPDLRFTQSADFLYIFHKNVSPKTLTRTSDTVWTHAEFRDLDGPYLIENTSAITLNPSAATGTITIAASAALFTANDVGRLVRIKHTNIWGYARITVFTSDVLVSALVLRDFNASTAVTTWRLGSFAIDLGYPRCGVFFDERLIMAGSIGEPNTYWASTVGDFGSLGAFSPTGIPGNYDDAVTVVNAFNRTLSSDQVNAIVWMISEESLLAGTANGPWRIFSSAADEGIAITNAQSKHISKDKCSSQKPTKVRKSVLYLSLSNKKIHSAKFDITDDGINTPEESIFAEHITGEGLIELNLTGEVDPIVWGTRADGHLIGLTFDVDQAVSGFHDHIIGGVFGSGIAVVESIAAVPSASGKTETLYLIVKRTVGGNTTRYVEFLEEPFRLSSTVLQEDAFFVDSGVTYSGAPATVIGGGLHLVGETVRILADGGIIGDQVVDGSGQITLSIAASKVHFGLAYDMKLNFLRPNVTFKSGSTIGHLMSIKDLILQIFETGELSYGPRDGTLIAIETRKVSDPMDKPPPLLSEDRRVQYDGDKELSPIVEVVSDKPTPATIKGIAFDTVTS